MLMRSPGPVAAHWALYRKDRLVGLIVSKHSNWDQAQRFCDKHSDVQPDGVEWILEKDPQPIPMTAALKVYLQEPKTIEEDGHTAFDLGRYA